MSHRLLLLNFLLLTSLYGGRAFAQQPAHILACSANINTFPYTEGFETSQGNWTTGGTSSDWAWGAPGKPVITSAGAGTKAWMTGGLTGSSYNNGELSFLESPCFDFTTLVNPQVSFLIFWETEKRFDGASFQYSIDNGGTWLNVGDLNSNSNCKGQNWYNTSSVTYLGNITGWSGNIQPTSGSCQGGGGSGGWLPAFHDLSFLAGRPQVKFRFLFGAGTSCNGFDGFAIDNVRIGEAPPNTVTADYTCRNSTTLDFTLSANCTSSIAWNFNDPLSGTNNTSSLPNPEHTFNTPGHYDVTVVVSFNAGPPVTQTLNVNIIGITTVTKPITCNTSTDGQILATASGGAGPFSYSWNTTPVNNTNTVSGLGAGTYTVTATAPNSCPAKKDVTLIQPNPIDIQVTTDPATCGQQNGHAMVSVSGDSPPWTYQWSDGSTLGGRFDLAPGTYSLTVTDAKGCSAQKTGIVVGSTSSTIKPALGPDVTLCPGSTLELSPGVFATYTWQDGSKSPTYTVSLPGLYYVTVGNAGGCTATDSINVTLGVNCSGVYFPSVFTPNGDAKNDAFGVIGDISNVKKYTMQVYNRYGERIYFTESALKKWDGRYHSVLQETGVYTWQSSFEYNGVQYFRKGTILLIR